MMPRYCITIRGLADELEAKLLSERQSDGE